MNINRLQNRTERVLRRKDFEAARKMETDEERGYRVLDYGPEVCVCALPRGEKVLKAAGLRLGAVVQCVKCEAEYVLDFSHWDGTWSWVKA